MTQDEFEAYAPLVGHGGALDSLIALVEQGPVWDGNVPSKSGRDMLIDHGLAVRVVADTLKEGWSDGYTAATYLGRDVYSFYFGQSGTMKQAKAYRIAQRAIYSAHAIRLSPNKVSTIPHCTNCENPTGCKHESGCAMHCGINLWGTE
jgi:hypothetical protein